MSAEPLSLTEALMLVAGELRARNNLTPSGHPEDYVEQGLAYAFERLADLTDPA